MVAKSGDTIKVYPGYYNESIVLNKQLNLIGIEENGKKPIIQAEENKSAVLISADGCTLKGFILMSQEILISDTNSPSCEICSDYNIIENNTFMYGQSSFRLNKSSFNIVTNNEIIYGYREGMETIDSNNNIISYNSARSNKGEGIELNGGSNNIISYNDVTKNCDGIQIWYSDNNIISFNQVYNNDQYGITSDTCSNLSILNNSIHDHTYGGLLLTDCSYCTISGNEIYSNQGGVMLDGTLGANYEGSTNNVVINNSIYSNGVGIYLEFHCENNYIKYNNFIDNNKNAYFWFYEKVFYNLWDKNYWSDWNLPAPKPIRGSFDIVIFRFLIRIPWFMFDMHPATEPYEQ